jgi:hypothetical protein
MKPLPVGLLGEINIGGVGLREVETAMVHDGLYHIGGTPILFLGMQEKIKSSFYVEISLVDLFDSSVMSSRARVFEAVVST